MPPDQPGTNGGTDGTRLGLDGSRAGTNGARLGSHTRAGTDGTTGTSAGLTERVRALERAVTDSDDPPRPVPDVSDVATGLDSLETRIAVLEESARDLEARQQAVEAYVDQIEHVNESVERRADAALAAVNRLESTGRASDDDGDQAQSPSGAMAPDSETVQPTPHVTDAASNATTHERGSGSESEPGDGDSSVLARLLGW